MNVCEYQAMANISKDTIQNIRENRLNTLFIDTITLKQNTHAHVLLLNYKTMLKVYETI